MARDGGRYVIVGQYTDNGEVSLNPHLHFNKRHLEIRGYWGSEFTHLYRGSMMMACSAATVDWESMISRSYRLSEAEQALDDVENLRVINPRLISFLGLEGLFRCVGGSNCR